MTRNGLEPNEPLPGSGIAGDRRYVAVFVNGDAADPGVLQVWSERGAVRFALITRRGHAEFETTPEFAGDLANALIEAETVARRQRGVTR